MLAVELVEVDTLHANPQVATKMRELMEVAKDLAVDCNGSMGRKFLHILDHWLEVPPDRLRTVRRHEPHQPG